MLNYYYMGSGVGVGLTELTSFDMALFSSGVANYNLVRVSSILPAKCRRMSKINKKEGDILYTAYATKSSCNTGEYISAAISVGIPANPNMVGVIMEYSAVARDEETKSIVENMVKESMELRGYMSYKIFTASCEAKVEKGYTTVFAGLSMWEE